ncbi:small ribosomal subunit protein bS16m [Macrobrachium rosenbergii]|uniref:small ribosomal subunit protein bS16m n=1 Tax=Macrobrachium rosenbergii TaxID=79674 RepID=UPI0034D601B9
MSGALLLPASGGARFSRCSKKAIRFAIHGCANRPFYHIVVMDKLKSQHGFVIEQLGTYDPMVNSRGEKLCSLNLERVSYWIGEGADISQSCSVLFGLAGLLPIHPKTYVEAWRNRKKSVEGEPAADT